MKNVFAVFSYGYDFVALVSILFLSGKGKETVSVFKLRRSCLSLINLALANALKSSK